jgi:hypothetical protein
MRPLLPDPLRGRAANPNRRRYDRKQEDRSGIFETGQTGLLPEGHDSRPAIGHRTQRCDDTLLPNGVETCDGVIGENERCFLANERPRQADQPPFREGECGNPHPEKMAEAQTGQDAGRSLQCPPR